MRKLTWSTATKSPNRRVSPSASIAVSLSSLWRVAALSTSLMLAALFRRKQGDEGLLEGALSRPAFQDFLRCTGRNDFAIIHRWQSQSNRLASSM